MNRRKGGALLETVMLMPLLLSLLIGTVELARVFYTYYMLEKVMYDLARYIGTQQGVNFCDPADPVDHRGRELRAHRIHRYARRIQLFTG